MCCTSTTARPPSTPAAQLKKRRPHDSGFATANSSAAFPAGPPSLRAIPHVLIVTLPYHSDGLTSRPQIHARPSTASSPTTRGITQPHNSVRFGAPCRCGRSAAEPPMHLFTNLLAQLLHRRHENDLGVEPGPARTLSVSPSAPASAGNALTRRSHPSPHRRPAPHSHAMLEAHEYQRHGG